MAREYWRPANMLYPVPAVMVSCMDEEGRANIMTAAWVGTLCSDPVMVSVAIRPERYSHDIIERTGEFVLNLTTQENLQWSLCANVHSGDVEVVRIWVILAGEHLTNNNTLQATIDSLNLLELLNLEAEFCQYFGHTLRRQICVEIAL